MSCLDISSIFGKDYNYKEISKKKKNKTNDIIPWVDKYRPKNMSDIVAQEHVIKILDNTILTGELPHLLLYGPAGSGKTSTILALSRRLFGDYYNERVIELNASDERGISVVRNKIKDYAKMSITSKKNKGIPQFKLIILDEADSMTPKAQAALRKTIEDYSHNTRFCFICNYINKIITPIISRCETIGFKALDNESMYNKLKDISNKEGMKIDKKSLDSLIEVSNGDMRQAIMLLWNINFIYKLKGTITPEIVYETADILPENIMNEIWDFCLIDNNKDTKKIVDISIKIKSYGFPITNLINQLFKKILVEEKINDEIKSKISIHLASTYKMLNDGGDEYIHFLNTLTFIKGIIVGAESEPIVAL